MRSSPLFLTAALAAAAVAGPLQKRAYYTSVRVRTVTRYFTVTASTTAPAVAAYSQSTHVPEQTAAQEMPAPPPEPLSSSSTAPGPGATSYPAAPEPVAATSSYPAAPEPVASTSSYPAAPEPVASTSSSSTAPSSTAAAPQASSEPSYGGSHVSGKIQATFSNGTDYVNSALWHHNRARANHGVAELAWSEECVAGAMKAASTCVFQHVTTNGQGQNIYATSGGLPGMTQAITNAWYTGEIGSYPAYGAEPNMGAFHGWGHYSQVIWKDTTHVGCVTVNCPQMPTNQFTVCNYAPFGNVAGQYAKNVLPPQGDASKFTWYD